MKKRYTPDFPAMMRLCECNFAQLRRLLPQDAQTGTAIDYQVNGACYRLTIQEVTRYTTLVEVSQLIPAVSC